MGQSATSPGLEAASNEEAQIETVDDFGLEGSNNIGYEETDQNLISGVQGSDRVDNFQSEGTYDTKDLTFEDGTQSEDLGNTEALT